jgi:hypothetical protein
MLLPIVALSQFVFSPDIYVDYLFYLCFHMRPCRSWYMKLVLISFHFHILLIFFFYSLSGCGPTNIGWIWSLEGWRLLSLVLSAQGRYSEVEVVVDAALDELPSGTKVRCLGLGLS